MGICRTGDQPSSQKVEGSFAKREAEENRLSSTKNISHSSKQLFNQCNIGIPDGCIRNARYFASNKCEYNTCPVFLYIITRTMQKVESKFVSQVVKEIVSAIFLKAFGIKSDVLLKNGPKGECDYVSASAIKEFNLHRNRKEGTTFKCKTVVDFARKVTESFFESEYISVMQANKKGFLQIKLKDRFIEKQVNDLLLDLTFPQIQRQKVVVDFSSPNIAKEMHMGHLRSTIIGESVCRILEFMGHDVVRANHVGDWGTQIGMLIAYMRTASPDYETNTPDMRDLDTYYKAARALFDSDPAFKKLSQETVVKLQAYDQVCIKAWKMICKVSREYFKIIYRRLNTNIKEFGESFYNPFIPPMVEELTAKGLIQESSTTTKKGVKKETKKEAKKEDKPEKKEDEDSPQVFEELPGSEERKAKCIFIEKYEIPLIVVKSDGGYNYDSTDLAAIQYRLQTLKADRVIYITDSGQREHFEMVIVAARKVGWLVAQRCQHMGFGVILGEEGKNIRILDLLNQARDNAFNQIMAKQQERAEEDRGRRRGQVFTALKPQEYEDAAENLGIASIKYYYLKQNRISDYIFSYEKILNYKRNPVVYLISAYVRMCCFIRKSGLTSQQITELVKQKPFKIAFREERDMAAMLIKFYDVLNDAVNELAINKVTDYIYEICGKAHAIYRYYWWRVGDEHKERSIILCEAIRKVLEKSFFFVGIVPIERI